ncbi:family 43 glycosylhydrolase [Chryseolinea lacunae]|uniref:Family 43 glycosylhydrolase n=1 Tax=Chryseolinea lacunae TaxID=2801331 RepID=A0ABS1KKK2_9BACT|nr:family 43 glycosylhydrolase [Chryseolinea lacunae]MBL0739991.1 family 43 glycosylhydrolase [Chryseolinea lacunae]
MLIRILTTSFFLFFTITSFAQHFSNPISDLADPHITFHEGAYYLTGTTGVNITVRKASTLQGLKTAAGHVVYAPAQGGPCCNYWAPELHRVDGHWYIYYTAGTSADLATQRTYVIENTAADPLSGTWTSKGRIFHPTEDFWAIDGTVMHTESDDYFLWSGNSSASSNVQRVYISKMSNGWTLTGPRTLLTSPEFDWERHGDVNEGPITVAHGGKIFMIYSASGCWTPFYALGMLTMNATDDPLDATSWVKSNKPVFVSNAAAKAYGPGHNGIFASPDGTETWNVYHATTVSAGACDYSRTTRAQRMLWKADGTPDFGLPVNAGDTLAAPSGEAALPVSAVLPNGIYRLVNRASGKVLDLAGCSPDLGADVHQWTWEGSTCQQWNLQATGDGYYSVTSRGGGLALDVVNCSLDNFANVQAWAPNGAACQQWKIESTATGAYTLTARHSGKLLTVALNSTAAGANVMQQTSQNATGQQWHIYPADMVITDVEHAETAMSFSVYPNPATGTLHIQNDAAISGTVRFTIADMLGHTVLVHDKKGVGSNETTGLNISTLPHGLYTLKISTAKRQQIMKVVFEK